MGAPSKNFLRKSRLYCTKKIDVVKKKMLRGRGGRQYTSEIQPRLMKLTRDGRSKSARLIEPLRYDSANSVPEPRE
jgi:hypothetical protein